MKAAPARRPTQPLIDYGVIGDLHSAALISKDGGLDWLCLPRFDSPSVFAALLDEDKGGRLSIRPSGAYESAQFYVRDTNVLRTEFSTSTGRAVLTSFMPVEELDLDEYAFHEVHLVFEVVEGRVRADVEFSPRFNYGLALTRLVGGDGGVRARGGGRNVVLASDAPMQIEGDVATGQWEGSAGDRVRLVLRYGTNLVRDVGAYETERKRATTEEFWRRWSERGTYNGRWRDAARRSSLALKLMTYAPTGALLAAATTGLPEAPGAERNWDYRYSWVRDSAFAMPAFHSLGYAREARRYLRWLRRLLRGLTSDLGDLRVCYGPEGETDAPEMELGHLRGYLDSRPVRVGNAAFRQFQLDIYGSIAHAIYEAYSLPAGFPDEAWRTARAIAEFVAEHWKDPDHGIWEIRGSKRRYTHSALMSWVAIDRALRIAQARGHLEYELEWKPVRDQIRETILSEGWDERRGAFVQVFGSRDLDASLLLVPVLGMLPATDPRVLSTIEAVKRELSVGPYVYRYRNPDGLEGQEGAFLCCSFWMVHALALAGRLEEAQERFDALGRLAAPLGLFSEQVDPATGRALGNFPQVLTHLSHLNAAVALHRLLESRQETVPGTAHAA